MFHTYDTVDSRSGLVNLMGFLHCLYHSFPLFSLRYFCNLTRYWVSWRILDVWAILFMVQSLLLSFFLLSEHPLAADADLIKFSSDLRSMLLLAFDITWGWNPFKIDWMFGSVYISHPLGCPLAFGPVQWS